MSYRTTKKDFKIFHDECCKWVKYFGLIDWEITYTHEEDEGCRASCTSTHVHKIATITLATDWDYKPLDVEIRKCGFHEACELLLAGLRCVAESRYATPDEVMTANHYIIRVLENTVYKGVVCKK